MDRRGSANENFNPSLYLIGPYLEAFNIEAFGLKTFNIAFIVRNLVTNSVYLDCRASI
jgi:hypothetical protein